MLDGAVAVVVSPYLVLCGDTIWLIWSYCQRVRIMVRCVRAILDTPRAAPNYFLPMATGLDFCLCLFFGIDVLVFVIVFAGSDFAD